ncbi:hypothetical protein ABTY20_12800 [Streptomyces sp. NPDC126497]|uniref:hypothetical protein n=1 Tax=Streptomyces sp. NPDC126497 TaxID=3155313 RepID=UPI003320F6EA
MGVFARIFRRSKTTEGTGTAKARTGEAAAGTGAGDAAGTAESEEAAGAPGSTGPAEEEAGGVTGTDTVEIPQQQSAEAAGSEAGKGART